MNSLPFTLEQQEAKKVLLWLSFECLQGGNPSECPMHSLRLRSYAERRRMLDQMRGPECLQLYELHRICLGRKESQRCRSCIPIEGKDSIETRMTRSVR
jgi:hypothetical protein